MKRNKFILLAVLMSCFSGALVAQTGLANLKSWAGRYPTHKRGRVTTSFFKLPEIRRPLSRLLDITDLNLLTREYNVETPIKQIGDYLAVKVCRPHACDTDSAGFAINLHTGFIFVRMHKDADVKWFGSNGTYTDLPAEVLAFLNDFAAT
ncbi:MAG: hypothetical protein QOJ64_2124 [Acidobacteriota bacterium]|jgi:hypothetical protein|nr:hypothetical protein [Acidobacteriota bacterium]